MRVRTTSKIRKTATAAMLLLASVTIASPSETMSSSTLQMSLALQRVQSGEPDLPDSPELRRSVIYDYLLAARLRRDLQRAPNERLDGDIASFLDQRADLPVGRKLNLEWLLSLGIRGRWDWFLPRAKDQSDADVICLRLAGRLATGETTGLAADVLARWRLPQSPPPACKPSFDWLRSQQLIEPAAAEARVREALAAGNAKLARELLDDVPATAQGPLLQWIRLLQSPAVELDNLAQDPDRPVDSNALVAGFSKWSIADANAAARRLTSLLDRPDLSPVVRGQLQRALALGMAYDRDPRALGAFKDLPPEIEDPQVLEWRVRAALWAGEFGQALIWIRSMPTSQSTQARWQYWQARAIEQTDGIDAATPVYAKVAAQRDYYGYLAADRLSATYRLNAKRVPVDMAEQNRLVKMEGLRRARALFDCDLNDEALIEWAVALKSATPAMRLQAALLASQWGWYAQSIATLTQLGQMDDVRLRYPRPFAPEASAASMRTRVPVDWIYAIMRQESLYRSKAVSSAGARGLMQVLPATGMALARRWNIPGVTRDSLFEAGTGLILGSAHLRELLDDHGGSLPLALAAYNAGAVPVARWRPGRSLNADIWVENIPYAETRNYVQRVLEHIVAFAWVEHEPLPALKSMMPDVAPTR